MSSLGTGLLAAFGGAAEGAGKAMGNQARAKKEETVAAAKAMALEEKEKNLITLRNEFSQQSQNNQNAFEVGQQGSGQFRDGHQLTKAEFDATPESERQNLVSTEAYGKDVAGQKFSNDKELLNMKIAGQKDIAGMRAASSGSNGPSTSDLKYQEDNAIKTLTAKVAASGGVYDPDSRTITVPTDKYGQPKKEIFSALSQSGFGFTSGKPFKEDKKGLFSGDNHFVTIYIEDYSPDRKAIGPQDQGSGGGDTFGELLSRAKSKNKGQQEATPPAAGNGVNQQATQKGQGILAGAGDQNQRMPVDPRTWNVQFMGQGNDKPYITIGNKIKYLTPEEYRAYQKATSKVSALKGIFDSVGAKTENE